jgi:lipopolysaccharide transport system ATP-binding protein
MSNTVITVENLSKIYRLGEIGTGTISRDMERWFKTKILKQEDPFLKIGETNDRANKGMSDIVYSLQDINFEINQGDAVGIIGRNGAGKSTLLKILSRVTTPTTGRINIKGRVASLLEVGTGFHPELTGRENIYLNGAILGMRKREIDSKLDEIIDFSGVERYIDTPVKRYSSGMYVRLAFAVAAHLESEILIVDEVLAVGDAEFQKKCLGKMGEVSKGNGKTILFVSHNTGAVKNLCNKGLVINSGSILNYSNVNESISYYLSDMKKLITKSLNFERQIIPNTSMYLKSASVKNQFLEETQRFEINEPIFIYLEIFCTEKIPGSYGYITIVDNSENLIVESDTKEWDYNVLDSLEIGPNKYLITIPRMLLAIGEKHVYLSFSSISSDNFNIDSPGNILSFEIVDNLSSRGIKRTALTSQILEWKKI